MSTAWDHADRQPHITLHGWVDGIRSSGRPRRRWLDNIEQECEQMEKTIVEAIWYSSKQAGVDIFCDEMVHIEIVHFGSGCIFRWSQTQFIDYVICSELHSTCHLVLSSRCRQLEQLISIPTDLLLYSIFPSRSWTFPLPFSSSHSQHYYYMPITTGLYRSSEHIIQILALWLETYIVRCEFGQGRINIFWGPIG